MAFQIQLVNKIDFFFSFFKQIVQIVFPVRAVLYAYQNTEN